MSSNQKDSLQRIIDLSGLKDDKGEYNTGGSQTTGRPVACDADKIKAEALDKLKSLLNEHIKTSSNECPLVNLETANLKKQFKDEELKEIGNIIHRLNCPLELINECQYLDVAVTCPFSKQQCPLSKPRV